MPAVLISSALSRTEVLEVARGGFAPVAFGGGPSQPNAASRAMRQKKPCRAPARRVSVLPEIERTKLPEVCITKRLPPNVPRARETSIDQTAPAHNPARSGAAR